MTSKGPERGHTLIAKFGANTAEELAWSLRHMADDIQRGQLTEGCSGSPSAGTIYSYKVLPEMTKSRYFAELDQHLEELAAHEKARRSKALDELGELDGQLLASEPSKKGVTEETE